MNAHESPTVSHVFELLNRWRHLPAFSLEPLVAPFFAIFLRDVLRKKFCNEIHETVIPEFPLRKGTLNNGEGNQSDKVDYVAFGKDNDAVYLVELKTDMDSRRKEQDRYLNKASRKNFVDLVEGIRKSAKASDRKQKYVHLLHQLHLAGFVSGAEALERLDKTSFSKKHPVQGWTEAINGLVFKKRECLKSKVVFIQPREDSSDNNSDKKKSQTYGFEFIYFEEVANIVQERGDLGCIFANYLRKWTDPAGSLDLRSPHRS